MLSGRHILIVEDEAAIALDLEDALRSLGAVVLGPVASVSDALSLVKKDRADCALLDINLGAERVDEVARTLKDNSVPIIFVTGYSRKSVPRGFESSPLVRKPYDRKELFALIASVFEAIS